MPRLFKTDFSYQNTTYSAIVTISNIGQEKKVSIELPDQSLQKMLPSGKITLDGITGLRIDEPDTQVDPILVETIWEVVDLHEQNKPEVSLWS